MVLYIVYIIYFFGGRREVICLVSRYGKVMCSGCSKTHVMQIEKSAALSSWLPVLFAALVQASHPHSRQQLLTPCKTAEHVL